MILLYLLYDFIISILLLQLLILLFIIKRHRFASPFFIIIRILKHQPYPICFL